MPKSHRKAAVPRNLAEQNQKTAEEKKMDNNGKRCFKKEGLGVGIWHMAKIPPERPATHTGVPGFEFQLHFWFQLPANVHTGRQ